MAMRNCKEGREPLLAIFVTFTSKPVVIGLAVMTIAIQACGDLDSLKRSCLTK